MLRTFAKLVLGLALVLLMIFIIITAWAIFPVTIGKELMGFVELGP